jgi:fumarylacetoacetase
LDVPADSEFPLENIPFGVFSPLNSVHLARPGTRIGDWVVDLREMENKGLFNGELFSKLDKKVFQDDCLNPFMGLSREYWLEARLTIQNIFGGDSTVEDKPNLKSELLYKIQDVQMHLPVKIGDYTDFYSSRAHAFNVGSIIRGPQNALNENWLQIPIGYHGRSSSIVASGTKFNRPRGQVKAKDATEPSFSDCKRLDFEMEVGAFLGGSPNELGKPIKVNEAWKHVFGFVLLNDWSFRDFQTW